MHGQAFFSLAFVLLAASLVAVPLAKRLGLGSVLGYLIAGIVVGPFVLNLVGDQGEDIMHFAEFGVVLMLFLIGLELNPTKLWRLRRPILGLGGLQVMVTALLLGGVALLAGMRWGAATAVGLSLALSSTAIVLQTLSEKNWMRTDAGQNAFAVLLFQDVAVIPILALMPLLADPSLQAHAAGHTAHVAGPLAGLPAWVQPVAVVVAMTLVVVVGRFVTSPVLRIIARTRLHELNLAAALVLVIGIALLMARVGLSPALGTFLAGVVLAGSAYRHELEASIEPVKGLLLGVFFVAVGASLDLELVATAPLVIGGAVLILIAIKLLVLAVLARAFGLRRDQNLLFTLCLAQGGEFAFVLLSFAVQQGVLPAGEAARLIVAVTLSMALTPLLLLFYERVLQPRVGTCRAEERPADAVESQADVIIVGFGHFGATLGRLLRTAGHTPTVLDNDSDRVDTLRRMGLTVYFGDATRVDVLRAAGAETARLLILALDRPEAQLAIVHLAKKHFPQAVIVARARGWVGAHDLMEAGVEHVFRETLDSSLRMGAETLRLLGLRGFHAYRLARGFRRRDEALLHDLLEHRHDQGAFLSRARERIHDLEQLMQAEMADQVPVDEGWDATGLREAADDAGRDQ
jgi:monovalent cation:proton antiporter-2 (CPA2) family protein